MDTKAGTVSVDLGPLANVCFVIMPFASGMERVYDKVFRPAIEGASLKPIRGDEISGHHRIMADIWDSIRSCRCVLVELTGKNANVFYELGLAHAIGKPVVMVTSDMADVPFDLRYIRCIVYDKNQPDWGQLLTFEVTAALQAVLKSHRPDELLGGITTTGTYPATSSARPAEEISVMDVSGEWEMQEEYDGGRTSVLAEIQQSGTDVRGMFIISDRPKRGEEFIIKESVSGIVRGDSVRLEGTSYQVIKGSPPNYNLDSWEGRITDQGTIEGRSADSEAVSGTFTMKRRGGVRSKISRQQSGGTLH